MAMVSVGILLLLAGGSLWWGRHELGNARREPRRHLARTTLYYAIILLGMAPGFAVMALARAVPAVPFATALLALLPGVATAIAVRASPGFAAWLLDRLA